MSATEKDPYKYSLPLYRSLTEPILLAGAPPIMIVFNFMIMAIFLFSFHFIWILPLNAAIHFGVIYITKQDPQAFDCLIAYLHQKSQYNT
jgi:type IV secretory pathway VirB3-like protein